MDARRYHGIAIGNIGYEKLWSPVDFTEATGWRRLEDCGFARLSTSLSAWKSAAAVVISTTIPTNQPNQSVRAQRAFFVVGMSLCSTLKPHKSASSAQRRASEHL